MNPDGDENQNNSNSASNTDPTQRAIFTPTQTPTPEPSRSERDSSVIVGSVVEPATTGLSHQYYSNHPTRTSASGVGDIVIGGSKPRKISKKAILLASVVVVILVIFIVVLAMLFRGLSSTPKAESSSAEIAFNEYANYLLFRREHDVVEGKFEPYQAYEIDRQLGSESFDASYWDEASSLLNDATVSLSQTDGEYKDEMMTALDNYRTSFNFIQAYVQITDEPSEEAMLQAYLRSGASGVDDYLNSFYGEIIALETPLAEDFVALKKRQYSLAIGKFDFYVEIGCIRNGTMVAQNCDQANITNSIETRFLELASASNLAMNESDALVRNSVLYLKSYCWLFSNWLKNPAQYSEDENED